MRHGVSLATVIILFLAPAARADQGRKGAQSDPAQAPLKSALGVNSFVDAPMGALATRRAGQLHLAGAPKSTDISALKAAGFGAIIDIRQASEDGRSSLEVAAKAAGIAYHNVPLFDAAGAMDAKAVAAISALHEKNEGVPHLVSCKSGNRSSAWYAAYAAKSQSLDSDKAIALGRQAYLRDDMAAAVRAYLTTSSKPAKLSP